MLLWKKLVLLIAIYRWSFLGILLVIDERTRKKFVNNESISNTIS